MVRFASLILLATLAAAAPKGHPSPTPTAPLPPPPSNFPTSQIVAAPSASASGGGYIPPFPSSLPQHCGPIDSTPLWLHTPQGAPLYNMCLDVKHGPVGKNAKLEINDCNGGASQNWALAIGQTGPLRVAGTDYCVDAGKNPESGGKVRLQRCDGSRSQQFFAANSGQFILNDRSDGYLCLDIKDGARAPGSPLQLYPCTSNNPNERFYPGFCFYHICVMDCAA